MHLILKKTGGPREFRGLVGWKMWGRDVLVENVGREEVCDVK